MGQLFWLLLKVRFKFCVLSPMLFFTQNNKTQNIMRDSFIFYRSFYDAIKTLPPENQAKIYNAIFDYSLNQNIKVEHKLGTY